MVWTIREQFTGGTRFQGLEGGIDLEYDRNVLNMVKIVNEF